MNAPAAPQIIESYRAGGFRIAGTRHAGSVVVFRDRAVAWAAASFAEIDAAALAAIVAAAAPPVEILLLGCGPRFLPVPPALRQAIKAAGAAVEPMDTGAACRTFNVLIAEERRVAAALIALA